MWSGVISCGGGGGGGGGDSGGDGGGDGGGDDGGVGIDFWERLQAQCLSQNQGSGKSHPRRLIGVSQAQIAQESADTEDHLVVCAFLVHDDVPQPLRQEFVDALVFMCIFSS